MMINGIAQKQILVYFWPLCNFFFFKVSALLCYSDCGFLLIQISNIRNTKSVSSVTVFFKNIFICPKILKKIFLVRSQKYLVPKNVSWRKNSKLIIVEKNFIEICSVESISEERGRAEKLFLSNYNLLSCRLRCSLTLLEQFQVESCFCKVIYMM